MSESIRQVTYYKIMVPNKAGQGARLLDGLKNSGINLLAFSGFPAGKKAQLDFIPEDPAAFERTAKQAGIKVSAGKPVFLVQGEDRVGALAEISAKLAAAKINLTALDGISSGMGQYGAIFWVKPKDVVKAARAVGAV
ncbi:MAG: hypothetical protein L0Z48_12430 [candidate division Zixibacteria bacterium]|nr:hypothetical protein [candidate division Zixibacteria bacterium]MCI0597328.1 hypothetical protein [candidate division Zixibacteria bacterium]